MNRRDFLKAGATGLVIPWWAVIPEAQAQQAGLYTGRILVNVHADGGLDQSSWTDPRETDRALNNYAGTPANVSGNIRSAPMGNNRAFFDRYFRQMLVINGVHSETNSHEDGARAHATGRLDMGYPNISELFASVHGRGLPMAWLNAGGFRTSAGLAAATPMPSLEALRALVTPNAQNATTDFMKQQDLDRTLAARAERMRALAARSDTLPRMRAVAQEFLAANESRGLLARVAQFLPATLDANFPAAHVGLVAAQAGITSTIQLSTGGFDTHDNHDNRMATALPRLTDLIDYIWQKSAELGIANRILVRIYTEFGRTPLNSGNGKDHWSVGSQVLMEAQPAWGNRVFGASGPRHEALRINPQTGAVDPANGVIIRPRHIHAALRTYLGINTTDPRFDLKVPANENFAFFDPNARTGYPNL